MLWISFKFWLVAYLAVETDKDTIDVWGWLKSVIYQYRLSDMFGFGSGNGSSHSKMQASNISQETDQTREN
jgi:hypothetical protein